MNALQWFRKIHLYLGIFSAPAILFFAISGGLQTLNLNDASRDGSYKPPQWLRVIAQVHKKQTAQLPARKPLPPAAIVTPTGNTEMKSATALTPQELPQPQPNLIPLKVFFVIVCASLFVSTISGIYLSWKYRRNRVIMAALLALGTVIPLVLLKF